VCRRPAPAPETALFEYTRTLNFCPPRHPAGGRGAETYVAPPSAGRRPAVGPPQMLPPAGPSHLTPSRPGEAKSRSREAPRCPRENENPNKKTAVNGRSGGPGVGSGRSRPSVRLLTCMRWLRWAGAGAGRPGRC